LAGTVALLTRLPTAITVEIVPDVGFGLGGRIRVGIAGDANTRIVPIESVVRLDDRPAFAAEVVGDADARRDLIPGLQVLLGEDRRRP
jgi:hypothetical protein